MLITLKNAGFAAFDLTEAKKIGDGGEGKVYEMHGLAFKIFNKKYLKLFQDSNSIKRKCIDQWLVTKNILKGIIAPEGIVENEHGDEIGFWMKLLPQGTIPIAALTNILKIKDFPPPLLNNAAEGVVRAVQWLHSNGFWRADGRMDNWFLDINGNECTIYMVDADGCASSMYGMVSSDDIALYPDTREWGNPRISISSEVLWVALLVYRLFYKCSMFGATFEKHPDKTTYRQKLEAGLHNFLPDAKLNKRHPGNHTRGKKWDAWLEEVARGSCGLRKKWPSWMPAQAPKRGTTNPLGVPPVPRNKFGTVQPQQPLSQPSQKGWLVKGGAVAVVCVVFVIGGWFTSRKQNCFAFENNATPKGSLNYNLTKTLQGFCPAPPPQKF